jgi:hypothetical protein
LASAFNSDVLLLKENEQQKLGGGSPYSLSFLGVGFPS